jgi:hypothetical protein
MHGGKTPQGAGSVHFKHGRYSSCLSTRLAAAYEDAMHDPKLLELRDEIATVDARMIDLLKCVDTGESGALWWEAQAAMAKFCQEQQKNNISGMRIALEHVDQVITHGAGDYAAWVEIPELIEQRRRLCDSDNRRLTQAHELIDDQFSASHGAPGASGARDPGPCAR